MSETVTVALDVGGTTIKCALVDADGEVRYAERIPTNRGDGPAAVVDTIVATAARLATRAVTDGFEPLACGVVVAGVVDESAGIARWSANLGLRDAPLRDLVGKAVDLPTVLGHDVRAGALAEARLGAGRTTRRMFFVAIGTGIAGAYAVDGQIDPGAHGAGGEIGHVIVRTGPDAAMCGCGARGCVEAYASAAAIGRAYADGAGFGDGDAAEVARRVAAGEPRATAVWAEAVDVLADGLLIAVAIVDPRVIVLGGGLAGAGATLLDPLRAALEHRRTFHHLPDLTLAELGDEAGVRGAALLALDLLAGEP